MFAPEIPADRCTHCGHSWHGLVCGVPTSVTRNAPCRCAGDTHQRGAE